MPPDLISEYATFGKLTGDAAASSTSAESVTSGTYATVATHSVNR